MNRHKLEKLSDDLFPHFKDEPELYKVAFDSTIGGYTADQGDMNIVSELEDLFSKVQVYRSWRDATGRNEPDLIHRIVKTAFPYVWQLTDEEGASWVFSLSPQAVRVD